MTRTPRALSPHALAALDHLGALSADLGEVEEAVSYGNPALKTKGRPFAVLDCYKGVDCLWLRVAPDAREALLTRPGWFASPYDPLRKALCVDLRMIDWGSVKPLLDESWSLSRGADV